MIVDHRSDYVVSVKVNRRSFYHAIVAHCALSAAVSTRTTTETGHGRYEQRCVRVWTVPAAARAGFAKGWPALRRIICVERTRGLGARQTTQVQYYISSLSSKSAEHYGAIIRSHWHIENRLHYPRDVAMHEDRSSFRNRRLATTFAMLRTIAFNLFRAAGYDSIKAALLYHSNRVDRIERLIFTT